jgi:hypothetical protein
LGGRAGEGGQVRVGTVACEPTGHRWRVADQLAAERGLALVCVQPLLVWWAREAEDLTLDKSDPTDAAVIARLAAGLHCYQPERAEPGWARLRHLGARRVRLTADVTAEVTRLRDLLECVWPAVLTTSGSPLRSKTWCVRRWRWRWTGRPSAIWAGCADWGWPGSPRRSAASCRDGAGAVRVCGSSVACSPPWPIRPAYRPTGWVGWSEPNWRSTTGGRPAGG